MDTDRVPIIMLAPGSAVRRRTRLKKQADVLLAMGCDIRFFGWEREPGEMAANLHPDPHISETAILRGGGYGSSQTRLYYPLWMLAVFWRVLRLPRRANLVCLGFETAFPALLAAAFTKARVIFDDADRFSMVLSLPGPVRNIVQRLERWTSRHALLHLIPGRTRYDWDAESMRVLRNSPNRADFEKARVLHETGDSKTGAEPAAFTLYANGWIGETRGAPIFLDLMQRLSGDDVRLKLIGRGDGAAYDRLCVLPNVDAQSEVPQVEALAAYLDADLALTYYDPRVAINRQAESNKWGDCVYLGIPFVVNSEVETARGFVTDGAAYAVPYADVDALEQLVRALAADAERMAAARRAVAAQRQQFLPFDEAFEKILSSGPSPVIEPGHPHLKDHSTTS